ncbi:glutamate synthase, large subunit [Candidatus Pelagibacter sp. HTCC7211]|uniref:glutamate synthase large subunit n=1 Tax=Pelagibacter sp. (strain HTCC7211) TaxID=439493 RepID=UPI000183BE2D|nr:glutamate synthase large subunit [Candidatus Pelagibacter sp. HTCC7211]EDZ59853.1 glutamate synthase, large subunit [Candidatus Pelagibacter sp. HTCC7211]MBD1151218.1 glutamate synthase large subunit [Pelagibacterales bacterium SAG-MED25]
MENYKKNLKLLEKNHVYSTEMEHDACGVGVIASTEGKKSRQIVEYGIEALKAVWHRGAVDADGKTGDGAGIHVEIPKDFFIEKIEVTGHDYDNAEICVGMIFLPRNDYAAHESCKTIVESELTKNNFSIYGWRQVPVNPKVLGDKALQTMPEIIQVLFKSNDTNLVDKKLERKIYETRKRIENKAFQLSLNNFYVCSISSKSIIYKGLYLAEAISDFYLDLKDERFVSRYAIFHQRFSTNTAPSWSLAQPFRAIAHNGEINTYKGNKNWMKVHEQEMSSPLFDNVENLKPVIQKGVSDSAALDNVFELLNKSGQTAPLAKLMLVPDAWSKKNKTLPKSHQQLFNFLNSTMEPWDGPAAIAATDNEWIIAANDRNGLRPLRYAITKDKLLFAGSETGMIELNEKKILTKGRLGPGEIIGVRIEKGKVFFNDDIKDYLAKEFKQFNSQIVDLDEKLTISNEKNNFEGEDLRRRQYTFGISLEDLELILHPMAEDAKEAIGSMGDDTPLAVLSDKYRPLYHFFRQNFSQVTNPPIDSLRENKVMSLKTRFGNLGNILDFDTLTKENIYVLNSPILSNSQFNKFINFFGKNSKILDCTFSKDENLSVALERIQKESEIAVRQGVTQLILSDKNLSNENLPIPMLLSVGAINTYLITKKLRGYVSINVQSGEAMDTHSFATLLGVGATTVNPYLAFDSLYQRHTKKLFGQFSFDDCVKRYINSVNAGLLKIMSKMGISVLSSYRGGCNFETVGLSRTVVDDYFPGITSKISGIGLTGIEKKIREIHKEAFDSTETVLPIGGIYRYRKNGETHQYQGKLIHLLQSAVGSNSYEAYKRYAEGIYNLPPINLRDLINFRKKKLGPSIDLSEVEPIEKILKRFGSGSMSHGALSKEAHETLAIGMNRIKGASCSGEGGEDEKRFKVLDGGDSANSRVKQIASARFGVTINYLNNCNEIEIKIAQGAKPGEGGQLPGFKVTEEIAKLRHSTPGVTLISPPPHHDIYSIEDLAQLIYDLKQINPKARIGVKLVASSGVGTIAAGVAKAEADIILISGHNGGTGATPQTSVKYVGIPWEMGLTEANQVLTLNNLRHKVTLRTDGGIKTGRDVVIAAMMGAEEYGVATTALVAMGCIMVRQCHSNTCPVGVCTQDDKLREKFTGTPDKIVNLFTFIASEVREILAELGFKSLNEIIGRTDLLMQVNKASPNLDDLDLNPLFVQADPGNNKRYCENSSINKVPDTLDQEIWPEIERSLDNSEKIEKEFLIKNTNRAVGTRISHHLYVKYGYEKLEENFLELKFKGSAGQSFGAFTSKGLKLTLKGDANDYVGKGLSGSTISIKLSDESNLVSNENTIIGNTVLYGATSGKLFAAGQAGDRFAVRNSGATAVVEGCDSNGCEYMTGGTVVILGEVGDNFAAGMTGGMAFVYDRNKEFEKKVNPESVVWQNLETDYWKNFLKSLVIEHVNETGSDLSKQIIENFDEELNNFVQVCPKEMLDKLSNPISLKSNIKEVS